jgi:hypothetical protein
MQPIFDHSFKSIAKIENGNYVLSFIESTIKKVSQIDAELLIF